MAKYRRLPETVYAQQYVGDPVIIKRWVTELKDDFKSMFTIDGERLYLSGWEVPLRHWLVRDVDGIYSIVGPTMFAKKYQVVVG